MSEPFDETAKLFFYDLFSSWGLAVETEREVYHRGRTIDLVVDCSPDDQKPLSETVFSYFEEQNPIELKGNDDPLNLKNYSRSLMRAWSLGGMDEPKDKDEEHAPIIRDPSERTLTIICVKRPNKILSMPKLKFAATDDPGIYLYDGQMPIRIIYPTELELIPKNYVLLPLAKGQKLEQFIDLCLREGLTTYLQLILDVGLATDPDAIWRKIIEVTQMPVKIREDTWPYIDRFFNQMPEAFQKLPTFRDALDESQRIAMEEGQRLGQRLGSQRTQQRILVRQLRRKFSQVPEPIVQRIETTESIDLLDRWLDEILMADDLAETELGAALEAAPEMDIATETQPQIDGTSD